MEFGDGTHIKVDLGACVETLLLSGMPQLSYDTERR